MHFFPQKINDPFLVVALNTQAETAKFNHCDPPNLQISPSKNVLQNFTSSSAWELRLQRVPINYAPRFFFSAQEGARAASATRGYSYVLGY